MNLRKLLFTLLAIYFMSESATSQQKTSTTKTYNERGLLTRITMHDENDRFIYEKLWNDEGTLLKEEHYLNNELDGIYKEYDEKTGLILIQAEYKEDNLHGLKQEWHKGPDHFLKEKAEYTAGRQNGEFAYYHSSGNPKDIGFTKNFEFHGTRTWYNDDGTIEKTISYFEGELDGVQNSYYANGQLERQKNYSNGKQHGLESSYDKEGHLTSKLCYIDNKQQDKLSPCVGEEGKPYVLETKYQNGQTLDFHTYLNGEKHGEFKYYSSEGVIIEEGQYMNDQFDGERKFYFDNGDIRKTLNYKDGKLDQKEKRYFEDGKIKTEIDWNNGNLTSVTEYYQNENVKAEKHIKVSLLRMKEYWDNGNLQREGKYHLMNQEVTSDWFFEYPEGEETFYSYEGKLSEKRQWHKGKLDGAYEFFDKEEKVLEIIYEKGVKTTERIFNEGKLVDERDYHPDGSIKQ